MELGTSKRIAKSDNIGSVHIDIKTNYCTKVNDKDKIIAITFEPSTMAFYIKDLLVGKEKDDTVMNIK